MLQQLGGFVFGSVPTMVLFLATLAAYRLLVHVPLTKILGERYARTQGAIEKATQSIAVAEARTSEYEHRLHAARAATLHHRQERLHAVHVESEKVLAEARAGAQQRSATARIAIEAGVETARRQLDASIDELVAQVIASLLPAQNDPSGERA
ncbi:MAG: F0F1 ATP synthase subunit B family protein [Acidobacteriaceae bacterium]